MPAIDVCEPQVIRALEKDGWHIIKKPVTIYLTTRIIFADIKLRQNGNSEYQHIIVLEVKCFTHPENDLNELYTALGQYLLYRSAIRLNGENAPIYLVLPSEAYQRLFQEEAIVTTFHDLDVKLVIIDLAEERVIEWIP
jgi:hypothetical protein